MDYHILEQQGRVSDDRDQRRKSEGGEKDATTAYEGGEEAIGEIGEQEDRGSEMLSGGSPSETNLPGETASLDNMPDASRGR
ncbi:hypothetical protein NDU88_006593 [Pleurodeles waltl]|uniref:Uncharacterized protein n=1 Tax=Pleurodeles waltl TaxID=8319 RepID=A0AAV7TYS0_PLEWA|nr:hypothetical protein NDU88_006593 [Pleurodeles waltl]